MGGGNGTPIPTLMFTSATADPVLIPMAPAHMARIKQVRESVFSLLIINLQRKRPLILSGVNMNRWWEEIAFGKAKARRKKCAVSLLPPNQKTAFRHSYHEEKQDVKKKTVSVRKNVGQSWGKDGFKVKKAKLFPPNCHLAFTSAARGRGPHGADARRTRSPPWHDTMGKTISRGMKMPEVAEIPALPAPDRSRQQH